MGFGGRLGAYVQTENGFLRDANRFHFFPSVLPSSLRGTLGSRRLPEAALYTTT